MIAFVLLIITILGCGCLIDSLHRFNCGADDILLELIFGAIIFSISFVTLIFL